MRYKWIYGVLALFVSALMLMPNVFAAPIPPVWLNQATLSLVDAWPSEDPENSGFGLTQVVVWEEWNPVTASWDIMMRYNLVDGAPPAWTPLPPAPPITVAGTPLDEINPAVTVTNINPVTLSQEVHVVYQCWNPAGQWDIYHTWTPLPLIAWSAPFLLDITMLDDAIDPAVVYTEDLSNPPPLPGLGTLVQFTWSEQNPVTLFYEIQYNAYYFDPTAVPPVWGYVGPTLISSPLIVGDCEYPEIASVDETLTPGIYDYYFAIVWQETNAVGQINIMYNDGTTTIAPGPPGTVLTPGSLGQLNPVRPGDSYHPDIAAAQDYYTSAPLEIYYFHVNWVYQIWRPAVTWQIDTCYASGIVPTPGAAALALGLTAPARGPVNFVLDNPTIATKLIPPTNGGPVFETWMCWEDNSNATPANNPDIWFRVGQYTWGGPPFAYTFGPAKVPYANPIPAPAINSEYNPELWNRGDSTRIYTLFTHLVFDMTQLGPVQDVEYIDP